MSHGGNVMVWLKRLGVVTVAVLMTATIAGCGDDSFEDFEELRETYVEAGGHCDELVDEDLTGTWSETGTCFESGVQLFIYSDKETREAGVETLQSSAREEGSSSPIWGESAIIAENWMIFGTDGLATAARLEGEIETFYGP